VERDFDDDADTASRTFNFFNRGGQSYKWEYEALANDDYYVWIKAGDPYVGEDRQFKIYAEGETIIDGTITSDNR
jgi:hypothetical protein